MKKYINKLKINKFCPAESGTRRVLGELEADIMDCIWFSGSASVRDICDQLNKKREVAYTTVMTVMNRLAEKGLLVREKNCNAFMYSPSISKVDFQKKTVEEVLKSLFSGISASTLSHFVEAVSNEDGNKLDELERRILKESSELSEGEKLN